MKKWKDEKAKSILKFKTGKLDSNAAVKEGKYPFFTCAQETYYINDYAYDTECVLLAGNNAAGIFPLKYFKGKFNAYQRTYIIEAIDKRIVNIRYIFEAFKLFLKSFEQTSTGATTKFLTIKILHNLPIPLPPLPIQKKIAAILSAYDDLIEKNNRRISILEKMAEELYKEWFVRLRFPGYEKTKIKNGIPEGWEVKRLGDVCIKITDGSHTSPSFFEGGYFMASVKDMTAYGFNFSEMKTISEADFDKLVKMDCKPLKNDVLIAKDGSYLKHVFVWDSNEEVVILSSIAILRPNIQEIQPYFFALTLKQDSVKNMMTGFVSGSALPRIILKAFKEMKILVPQNSVMEQFENIIKPVYKNIRTLLDTISNLTSTRDRLLSRLLSGKIDVENLDIKFPDSMKEDS